MSLAPLSASFQSLPQLPTIKLGPSGADFRVDGLVYILAPCWSLQGTLLWRWEFLSLTGVFSQVWGFISPLWNPELRGLSRSLVVPPSLSARECGTTQSAIHHLASSASCSLAPVFSTQLPLSAPTTDLDECFFFKSLVVGLPYSLIFCQFWMFFVFKFVVSFFWLCEEAQCVYLRLHLGWKSCSYVLKESLSFRDIYWNIDWWNYVLFGIHL